MMEKLYDSANHVLESIGNLSHCHAYNISTDRFSKLMWLF